MFLTILTLNAGSAHWTGVNIPEEVIVAGLFSSLYAALSLTIPIVILWWLKNLSWGTFAVYSLLLSAGFAMQSAYQELLGDALTSTIMWMCSATMASLSVYFLYKNYLHMKALADESKRGRSLRNR